jgi:hypothetical protein
VFGSPGRILYKQASDIKYNMRMPLTFSSPVSLLSVPVSLDFPCTAYTFFPERLSNHCQDHRSTFSEICRTFDALPSSDPLRDRIRPDKGLQKKDVKISTSWVELCTLTPKVTPVRMAETVPEIMDPPSPVHHEFTIRAPWDMSAHYTVSDLSNGKRSSN